VRLLEAHGIGLRLTAGNKRFPLDPVEPVLVVEQRDVGITPVCASDAKLAAVGRGAGYRI